jgi:hypothetical protein
MIVILSSTKVSNYIKFDIVIQRNLTGSLLGDTLLYLNRCFCFLAGSEVC